MSTFHREYLIATRYLIANRELQYELGARNESVSRVELRPDRRAPRRPRDALAMGVFAKKKRTPAELAVKLLNSLNSLGGGGGGEKARPRPSPRRPLARGRASSDDRNNERSLSRVDRSFPRVVPSLTFPPPSSSSAPPPSPPLASSPATAGPRGHREVPRRDARDHVRRDGRAARPRDAVDARERGGEERPPRRPHRVPAVAPLRDEERRRCGVQRADARRARGRAVPVRGVSRAATGVAEDDDDRVGAGGRGGGRSGAS